MTLTRPDRSTPLPGDADGARKPVGDWRLRGLRLLIVLCFSLLTAQLWRLQIVEGRNFRQLADINRFRVSSLPAPRGVIYDRDRKIVAANTPSFRIAILPAALPKENPVRVYRELGDLLGMNPAEIADKVDRREGNDFEPVVIQSDVERDVVLRVEERSLKMPGVTVAPQSSRLYPFGPLMSQILGYMLPISEEELAARQADAEAAYRPDDRIGATGIEASYERELRGKPGKKLYEVDASERPVNDISVDEPNPGYSLTLSVDVELQRDV